VAPDRVCAVQALYVDRGGRTVVREASLTLNRGEILAILGPSGAGKSTLFDAMMGLCSSRGRVLVHDRDVSTFEVWRRARAGLGYVPQKPSVLLDLSVIDNLTTLARLAGSKHTRDALEKLACSVSLGDRINVPAGQLSGGERRRLELARARLSNPMILLCDEPFAGVDPRGIDGLCALLSAWANEGLAIAISDHHVEEALSIASSARLLVDGVLGPSCEPQTFLSQPSVMGRYLSEHR
jgi:lipopolysaccharide export system ATP-binding protein